MLFQSISKSRTGGGGAILSTFHVARDTWPLVAFDVQTYLQSCIQTYRGNSCINKETTVQRIMWNFYSRSSHDWSFRR